jgi:phage gp16-like protein
LKRDLALDDEIYHVILDSVAGKTSCKDIGDEDLKLAMLALERMVAGGKDGTSVTKKNVRQHRFIARLMDYLGWTWKQTARFCHHQTGKRSTRSCDAGELSKIIIGMIRIIDEDVEKGRLKLTETQMADYQRYTKLHRQGSPAGTVGQHREGTWNSVSDIS